MTPAQAMSEIASIRSLVDGFVDRVPGAIDAILVSSDGLPLAASTGLDRDAADRFAAVASGLIGLSYGAAGRFGGGPVNQVIIEMANVFLFVAGVSGGSLVGVVADADADVGQVGYELAELVNGIGRTLGRRDPLTIQGLR